MQSSSSYTYQQSPVQIFSNVFIEELKLFAYNKLEICGAEILCITL